MILSPRPMLSCHTVAKSVKRSTSLQVKSLTTYQFPSVHRTTPRIMLELASRYLFEAYPMTYLAFFSDAPPTNRFAFVFVLHGQHSASFFYLALIVVRPDMIARGSSLWFSCGGTLRDGRSLDNLRYLPILIHFAPDSLPFDHSHQY